MSVILRRPADRMQMDVSLAIVNIVLLLVFFFVATGQLLNAPSFGMELAETEDLPLDRLPTPILIVGADGEWSLDGEPLAPDLLGVAVSRLAEPAILHLLIDRDQPASTLLSLLARPELDPVEVRLVTLHLRTDE